MRNSIHPFDKIRIISKVKATLSVHYHAPFTDAIEVDIEPNTKLLASLSNYNAVDEYRFVPIDDKDHHAILEFYKYDIPQDMLVDCSFRITLDDIASKGGNYFLNIGPKADGTFPEASMDRLKDIGLWMKVNGEAICGTKASPIDPVTRGRCTRKDSKKGTALYLSVFEWPKDGKLLIHNFTNSVISAKLLPSDKKLKTSLLKDNGLTINIPVVAPDKVASVIKIEVKGKMETRFSNGAKKMKSGALD